MPPITRPTVRVIIDDFADEIRRRLIRTAKPSKTVINFRTEMKDAYERDIVQVPAELLRYRKDNGRISSDVIAYEQNYGPLDEQDEAHQSVIMGFLEAKDREQSDVLLKSILHDGQRDPAIITCDGFLINGNRRKMAIDKLRTQDRQGDRFVYRKVVILPGHEDPGGPPTLLEIEKIENRYQLQSDGKAEYYSFDRALSIRRKVDLGLTLEEQLRDDPRFAQATAPELSREVKKYEDDYLTPLSCIDRYLRQFGRDGQYNTISTGMADREGRWQAFLDYSTAYSRSLCNAKWRAKNGVDEDEIGRIEKAAFDLIRLREVPDMGKIHTLMRNLPKLLSTHQGKDHLLQIADTIKTQLPKEECHDATGQPLKAADIDAKWVATNRRDITWHIRKAQDGYEARKETETPLGLLDAAYKKLTHEGMDVSAIPSQDCSRAMQLAESVRDEADTLRAAIYHVMKAGKGNGPRR